MPISFLTEDMKEEKQLTKGQRDSTETRNENVIASVVSSRLSPLGAVVHNRCPAEPRVVVASASANSLGAGRGSLFGKLWIWGCEAASVAVSVVSTAFLPFTHLPIWVACKFIGFQAG